MTLTLRTICMSFALAAALLVGACSSEEPASPQFTDAEKELVAEVNDEKNALDVFDAAARIHEYLRTTDFDALIKEVAESDEDEEAKAGKTARLTLRKEWLERRRAEHIEALTNELVSSNDASREFRKRIAGPFDTLMTNRNDALRGIFEGRIAESEVDLKAIKVEPKPAVPASKDSEAVPAETIAHAIARTMNEAIREFYALWEASTLLDEKAEQSVTQFVVFSTGKDLPYIQGFKPITDEREKADMLESLRWFALRFPDGYVAGWITELDDKEPDLKSEAHIGNPLRNLGVSDSHDSAERNLARGIVEDLFAVFGKEMQPTKDFRKNLVKGFSEESDLTFPNAWALVLAIFGSVVLFGGLAWSIFLAVQSGRKERLVARSE